MDPKVSIIIPFYNCEFVDQALVSALNQTYLNVEIILVDDGSTVNTNKITPYLDKIKYIRKENGGTATALNGGIKEASGEYIAWLSSDDIFVPNKLSLQIASMLLNDAVISFTNYDFIDKHSQVYKKNAGSVYTNEIRTLSEVFKRNPFNGSTVLMKKSVIEKEGYFNPNFRFTHDYEMWLRLVVKGYKIHYLDEALLKYRVHEKSGTRNNQTRIRKEIIFLQHYYRNQVK